MLPDKSKDETLLCLGDKKYAAQSAVSDALTGSTLSLAASGTLPKSKGSGVSLSVTLAGSIFTDTQAHGMYEEFLNVNDNI